MIRQMQEERQMRERSQGSSNFPFQTPQYYPFDYEAYELYGSEQQTASANYRPRNSNTALRKKPESQ